MVVTGFFVLCKLSVSIIVKILTNAKQMFSSLKYKF